MPPKPLYNPIPLSQLTPENVAEHLNGATRFLAKYKRTAKDKRGVLGGETHQRLVANALQAYTAYLDQIATMMAHQDDQDMEEPDPADNSENRDDPMDEEPPSPDQDPKRALQAVIGKISFLTIRDWGKTWAEKRHEFTSHTYTSPPATFQPLFNACSNLQRAILEACKGLNLNAAIIGWPTMANERPDGMDEIRRIHEWLVVHDLIDEPVEIEVTTGKSSGPKIKIWDYEKGKKVKMTPRMIKEARDEPDKWPGCVEAGIGIIKPLFNNHIGSEKCLSCKDGARGKGKIDKGGDYLSGCECPVETAALELWLTKINAKNPDTPLRQAGDGKIKRENAFNPTTLRFIEGGIAAVSGHTVRSLLQTEKARLEHTAIWALSRLSDMMIMENPAHQEEMEKVLAAFKTYVKGQV
ncbi:hypothetical protein F5887DRAFT_1256861 [Amanita rubescens]|nr:hypothetical protein F5887DRAFT_1256861 [Amanita rubescens]